MRPHVSHESDQRAPFSPLFRYTLIWRGFTRGNFDQRPFAAIVTTHRELLQKPQTKQRDARRKARFPPHACAGRAGRGDRSMLVCVKPSASGDADNQFDPTASRAPRSSMRQRETREIEKLARAQTPSAMSTARQFPFGARRVGNGEAAAVSQRPNPRARRHPRRAQGALRAAHFALTLRNRRG